MVVMFMVLVMRCGIRDGDGVDGVELLVVAGRYDICGGDGRTVLMGLMVLMVLIVLYMVAGVM
jgi:hypothetical protein